MNLTDLPFVIHDTILFKNIEDDTMENIIVKYASLESKQVFIAFDHIASFSEEAIKILREHTILSITPGGRELLADLGILRINNIVLSCQPFVFMQTKNGELIRNSLRPAGYFVSKAKNLLLHLQETH